MSMHGENQVRNFFVVGTSTNTTLPTVRGGVNLNAAVVQSDGTAAVDNEEFTLAVLNNRGEISLSDIINPSRVKGAKSVPFVARAGKSAVVSGITAVANQLYQISVIIAGYGSLSVENEYVKEAFYKAKTGDTAENIVDGLIKSLARNFSREQPQSTKTYVYTNKDASTVVLQDNLYFEFDKVTTDGTAEISTLTFGSVATGSGNLEVTLNGGTVVEIPIVSGESVTASAESAVAVIDALNDYTALNAAGIVTITATNARVEVDLASADNGTTWTAASPAAATTTPGVNGTDFGVKIAEKLDWLEKYYVTGKKTRLYFDFRVDSFASSNLTVVETQGNQGAGTGYHVRNLEEYFLGNRGDSFRGAGYPHNFEQTYDSVFSGEYSLIEIEYYDEGRDDPMKSKKQLTIAAPSIAVGNVLIGQLNTALTTRGITLATLV